MNNQFFLNATYWKVCSLTVPLCTTFSSLISVSGYVWIFLFSCWFNPPISLPSIIYRNILINLHIPRRKFFHFHLPDSLASSSSFEIHVHFRSSLLWLIKMPVGILFNSYTILSRIDVFKKSSLSPVHGICLHFLRLQ